ncbi:hypothetical protein G9A89_009566 [Geosiphon pyriformis]|nr:hypothetical protein G9A89_009566 [Geosiphon pyriformis]
MSSFDKTYSRLARSHSFEQRERSLQREKIGNAGRGFGSLISEEGGKDSVADLLANVKDEDALKLAQITQRHANQKSRGRSSNEPENEKKAEAEHGIRASNFLPSEPTIAASRACKSFFEKKYSLLFEMIKENQLYNPLQVIRNRQDERSYEGFDSNNFWGGNRSGLFRIRSGGSNSSSRHRKSIWDITTEELLNRYLHQKFPINTPKIAIGEINEEQDKLYTVIEEDILPNSKTKQGLPHSSKFSSSSLEALIVKSESKQPRNQNPKNRRLSQPNMSSFSNAQRPDSKYSAAHMINDGHLSNENRPHYPNTRKHHRSSSLSSISNNSLPLSAEKHKDTHHGKLHLWSSLFKRKLKRRHRHFVTEEHNHEETVGKSDENQHGKINEPLDEFPNSVSHSFHRHLIPSSDSSPMSGYSSIDGTPRNSAEDTWSTVEIPSVLGIPKQDNGTISDEGSRSIRSMMASSDAGETEKDLRRRSPFDPNSTKDSQPSEESSQGPSPRQSITDIDLGKDTLLNESRAPCTNSDTPPFSQQSLGQQITFNPRSESPWDEESETEPEYEDQLIFIDRQNLPPDLVSYLVHQDMGTIVNMEGEQFEMTKITSRYQSYIKEAKESINQSHLVDQLDDIRASFLFTDEMDDIPFVQSPLSTEKNFSAYPPIKKESLVAPKSQLKTELQSLEMVLIKFEGLLETLKMKHSSLAQDMHSTLDQINGMALDANKDYVHELKLLDDEIQVLTQKRDESFFLDIFYIMLSYVLAGNYSCIKFAVPIIFEYKIEYIYRDYVHVLVRRVYFQIGATDFATTTNGCEICGSRFIACYEQ